MDSIKIVRKSVNLPNLFIFCQGVGNPFADASYSWTDSTEADRYNWTDTEVGLSASSLQTSSQKNPTGTISDLRGSQDCS